MPAKNRGKRYIGRDGYSEDNQKCKEIKIDFKIVLREYDDYFNY
jgi:hypothetical protein